MTTRSTSEINALRNYADRITTACAIFTAELRKSKIKTNSQQTGELLVQVIAFYYILLVKKAEASNISTSKAGSILSSVSMLLCNTMFNTGHISPQEAHSTLQEGVGEILEKYAHIPLSAPQGSKGLGGSLLWEYSKLIASTIGRPNDPIAIMSITSILTNTAELVNESELIDALNGKTIQLARRSAPSRPETRSTPPWWRRHLKTLVVIALVLLIIVWISDSNASSSKCREDLAVLQGIVDRSEQYLSETGERAKSSSVAAEYYNDHIPTHNQYVNNYNTRLAECR